MIELDYDDEIYSFEDYEMIYRIFGYEIVCDGDNKIVRLIKS